jgi:DNA mismatch repair protein MutS2
MNNKTLNILEFNKIKTLLKSYAETKMGQELVEQMMPLTDLAKIRDLQEETSEGVKILLKGINPSFGGIKDIRSSLKKAVIGGTLDPEELLNISDTLRSGRNLKKITNELDKRSSYEIVDGLISQIFVYKDLEDKINSCILNEREIADNASNELYHIRRLIKAKQALIKDKLSEIINSPAYRKILQEPIITIRNERYVVPIKQEFKGTFPGIVHDQSSSGSTLFIEPIAVVTINNEIRELMVREKREIEKILKDLTMMVAREAKGISSNLSILSRLDFIFAKAKISIEMNGIQPLLNSNGYISIKQGRHPLLKGDVVPIDVNLGRDFNILVITGPNTGGKTVTLKTIGLLTLMAQSGLHIPACWGTEISVFDKVYADIGDEQSIEQNLSTFSSHMQNIINILRNIGKNSLVLLDEIGAGTDPTEGAALAMAILGFLNEKGIRTVATTHYSELKTFAFSQEGFENASVEFDVKTLRPTYRLLLGLPGKSNAFEIAYRLGLSGDIINRAKGFMKNEDIKMEELLREIHYNRDKTRLEREEAEKAMIEAEEIKKEYREKLENIKKRKEQILKQARQEALKIVEEAMAQSDSIIKRLNELQSKEEREKNKIIDESRSRLRSLKSELKDLLVEPILKENSGDLSAKIKPGDKVFINSLNQKGHVVSELKNGEIQVQVGIMKIAVPISTISIIKDDNEENEGQISGIGKIGMDKSQNISSELDLRGKTLQEAIVEVDKYIDDAYLAGLPKVTLIHGKGTGTLRKGIQEYLRENRLVASFRLGKYGEGGQGVTIVELIG